MKYYRVKPEYDNKTRYTWDNHGRGRSNGILIANELYTPAEYRKIANYAGWFETVDISPKNTHTFFGARFENRKEN